MSTYPSPDGKQQKKTGCFATMAKLCLIIFVFSIVFSFLVPKEDRASAPDETSTTPAAQTPPATEHPDYLNGVSLGETVAKEFAETGGGRPYPKGIELMARARLNQAKPGNEKEWLRGFEVGFTRGWDSVRGARNTEAYTALTWETAKTGTRVYDNNEKHVATIVLPKPESKTIIARYNEDGSIQETNFKSQAEFWFVKKQQSDTPNLASLQAEEWPKQVTLRRAVSFDVKGGQGSAVAPSGAKVDVLRYSNERLRVRFVESETEIAVNETNFEEEVKANFARKQQQEQQEIERLAAAETAKLEAQKAERNALYARIEAHAGKEPDNTSARVLVRVQLEKRLHDPQSVKYDSWSEVQYAEYSDGKYAWCITVNYRAKNAFGAYVRNTNKGYIRNERLISLE